jgi:hypothetical protein
MAQSFVLDGGCVTDPLVLAEDAIGKRVPFPSHLERAICEVVDLDILACQLVCYLTSLENDLSAVVSQGKLLAEVTLLAMAQDVSQAGRLHVQPAVHVLSFRCGHLELLVELLHEPGQEGVAGTHGTDAGKAQLSFGSKATGRCNTAAS